MTDTPEIAADTREITELNGALSESLDSLLFEQRVLPQTSSSARSTATIKSAHASSTDTTATPQAPETLSIHRRAAFIQRILESNQDCIKVLDLEGRLLYMNHNGQKIMEIDDFSGTVKNAAWLTFWKDKDYTAAKAAFQAARQGQTGKFDGYCATAKGQPKWWEVVISPIYNEQGQVSEILSVSRDITERKQAGMALAAKNQELERFTRVVSHDLKAPLRGISSLSTWLLNDLNDQIPEKSQQHLVLMQERVQRMNALVDGLLQLSRVGRQSIAPQAVNISELLSEVIDSVAPPDGFEIVSDLQVETLTGKRLLLIQVLTNCVSNAIKHHDKSTGRVEVTVHDQGKDYCFSIADDGPGIPDTERTRVLEIFQTLAEDKSTQNTGIGLAIVQRIIESEGGTLSLEENTPRGCKFSFTWPKRPALDDSPS
ncbi:MAG: PAS domain-containing sensor histidine kinase [Cyanobacteria bacterium J06614_10]